MASSGCERGIQTCRRLVGARPDDWRGFEETKTNGRSNQLEAEKWIDESADPVLNVAKKEIDRGTRLESSSGSEARQLSIEAGTESGAELYHYIPRR